MDYNIYAQRAKRKDMTTDVTKRPIPRKLNNGMIQALASVIEKGNYARTAINLCGISEYAFYDWLRQAKEDEELGLTPENSCYIRLAMAIKRAEANAEAKMVEVVRSAAIEKKEWLPAMTYLERKYPDDWGRRDRRTVDINERHEIVIKRVEVVMPDMIDAEYREIHD